MRPVPSEGFSIEACFKLKWAVRRFRKLSLATSREFTAAFSRRYLRTNYDDFRGFLTLRMVEPVVDYVEKSPASVALFADRKRIVEAIHRALDCINEELPHDRRLIKAPETRLLGTKSVLDSMQLVSLIVMTEREIEDAFGVALTLADERALSMKASPFRSIQALADYIALRVVETGNA